MGKLFPKSHFSGISNEMQEHNEMKEPALFLDFDGVLCDSLHECYETSLRAWQTVSSTMAEKVARNRPDGEDDEERKELFRRYRPFIRNGGDYLFLQLAIDTQIPLHSQEAFDQLQQGYPELSRKGDEIFQKWRSHFLSSNPERWFSLNPLFPGIAELLNKAANNEEVYILSTKPVRFIHEIVTFHAVKWPLHRIICSKPRAKVDVILEVMEEKHYREAIFVEDQIDHLLKVLEKGNLVKNIRPCLASWGYIKEEWKQYEGVECISIDTLANWTDTLVHSPFYK